MAMEGSDVVSLYVGDLEESVNEEDLFQVFNAVSSVFSIRVCRDQLLNHSLGYAYVNFKISQDAEKAKQLLNFKPLKGKPMRIMYSRRNLNFQKNDRANVFVKNLNRSIDDETLHGTFSGFGNVLSCKVARDSSGESRGFAFVQFEHEREADEAIKLLNGMCINDQEVYVGHFLRRQDRLGSAKFTNVYVKNLSDEDSDEDLKEIFGSFGEITSSVVMKDEQGKSKGFGFVSFRSAEAASAAVEGMNGVERGETVLFVGPAQKRANREAELRRKFEEEKKSRYEKLKGANLYVKNVDDDCIDGDEKLEEIFSAFGTITSCKLATDAQGNSRGFGFVAFATPEEASKAMKELNRKIVGRKPLYVTVAQRKEERKALMEAQRTQRLAQLVPGLLPVPTPRMGPPQRPMFFTQGAGPAMMHPPLPGFGFQRPVMMPRPFHHQWQQPRGSRFLPMMMTTRPMIRGPAGPQRSLASALASADPESQKTMLGERLYPMVERIDRTNASKVTGMLLEMDHTEVLHLIESPQALRDKVAEAVQVLRNSPPPKSVDGLNE